MPVPIIRHGSALTHIDPLLERVLLGTLILGPYGELAEASFPDNPESVAGNLAFRRICARTADRKPRPDASVHVAALNQSLGTLRRGVMQDQTCKTTPCTGAKIPEALR